MNGREQDCLKVFAILWINFFQNISLECERSLTNISCTHVKDSKSEQLRDPENFRGCVCIKGGPVFVWLSNGGIIGLSQEEGYRRLEIWRSPVIWGVAEGVMSGHTSVVQRTHSMLGFRTWDMLRWERSQDLKIATARWSSASSASSPSTTSSPGTLVSSSTAKWSRRQKLLRLRKRTQLEILQWAPTWMWILATAAPEYPVKEGLVQWTGAAWAASSPPTWWQPCSSPPWSFSHWMQFLATYEQLPQDFLHQEPLPFFSALFSWSWPRWNNTAKEWFYTILKLTF